VIARLAEHGLLPATPQQFLEHQDPSWGTLERCRERDECYEKLQKLGLIKPDGI
jgi:thymidylate synthase (FAD)